MVLQRVVVAQRAAELDCDARHLAGRPRSVRRERPQPPRLAEAAAACGQDDSACEHVELAARVVLALERRAEAVRRALERRQRRVVERLDPLVGRHGAAQRGRDRVAGAIAHLQQALARRAAAASKAIAAVRRAGEGDSELLEARDRVGRLAGQHLDEPRVGGLVRARDHIRRVHATGRRRHRAQPGCRPAPWRCSRRRGRAWWRAARARPSALPRAQPAARLLPSRSRARQGSPADAHALPSAREG